MSSMLRETQRGGAINVDALRQEIRAAICTRKANAGPICMRVAWHASGTFDKSDGSGGSDGATMRFDPERSDGANAGLSIIRDLLLPIKERHPEVSHADLWVLASVTAVELLGGPRIPMRFGRTDAPDGSTCPANGRLPDASLGAQHLRDVFHRMGMDDREIVALSGGHTLGRCHATRSGFDGPWTTKPLSFDNEYFVNLPNEEWVPREWDGPAQFQDKKTGKLMMLPTDVALLSDDKFRPHVERYAKDQMVFFKEFSAAYAKLVALGCPAHVQPDAEEGAAAADASAEFREHAMHGSVLHARQALERGAQIDGVEDSSGRTALHKAAFWGHVDMTKFLTQERTKATESWEGKKEFLNKQDYDGDTALHDAARFGHVEVIKLLVAAGADAAIENNAGETALAIATHHNHEGAVEGLKANL